MADHTISFSFNTTLSASTAATRTTFTSFSSSFEFASQVVAHTNPLVLSIDTPGTLSLSVDTPGTLSI